MNDLELITKACSRCGKEKPLSEYWKHNTGRFGRNPACIECARPLIDAAIARRRERLGEEEFKRLRRGVTQKHRASGKQDYRSIKARNNAYYELGRRHKDELEALVRLERAKLGLDPDSQRRRSA